MVASPRPFLNSRQLALGGLLLGVALASGAAVTVYMQREAIAVRLAFDYLRAHGVSADIRLDRLDLRGAAGRVRLGAPGRPDLTVGRVEAQFGALPAPWRGVRAPPLRSLTLVRPVLHARLADGRLNFGELQPLIDQALHAKPSGAPAPDLHIRDGQLRLDTPAGPLVVALDADAEGGRVSGLHARLLPADLAALGFRLADVEGVVSGQGVGQGGLRLTGAFSAARGAATRGAPARGAASGLTLSVEGLAPNGAAEAGDGAARPLDLSLRLRADRFALQPREGPPVRVEDGELTADLDGQVDGADAFGGRLRASGRAARLARGGVELASAALQLQSAAAAAQPTPHGFHAQGPFTLSLAAAGGQARVADATAALLPLRVQAGGMLALGSSLRLQAAGRVQGGFGLSARDAASVARRATGGADPQTAEALAAALRRVRLEPADYGLSYDGRRGGVLHLDGGADAELEGGVASLRPQGRAAVAEFAPSGRVSGALRLALQVRGLPYVGLDAVRYALKGGAAQAEGSLVAEGGLGPLDDATLHLAGTVAGEGGRWTLTASDCLRLTAAAVRGSGGDAKVVATGLGLQACPVPGAPLLSLDHGAWRARAEARDLGATLPGAAARAEVSGASVQLDGSGGGLFGQVLLHGARVEDTGAAVRVQPLSATGALSFAGRTVQGRLALALARTGAPIGILAVDADTRRGVGEGSFDTGRLRLATDGLQPGDIAPAARALPQADGAVQLIGRFAWGPAGLSSSGLVSVDGLSFRSPAGKLDGLRGDIHLASLSPLLSEPGQVMTADRLETVIPLTALKAAFALRPDGLELDGASAHAAGGLVSLDPMRLPLAPARGLATSGVLRLKGVDLQQVISTLNLANSVKLQARVDGELPFALQPAPGGEALRLASGRIYSEGPGRLSIARQALAGGVATAGAAGAQPNAVQDFAYQALEDLAFTELEASVASRPVGRLGVVFHLVGRHDPKLDRGPTRIGLFQLLRGHAFDKPIPLPKGVPVDLTLDTSLNLDDILNSYFHLGGSAGSGTVQP